MSLTDELRANVVGRFEGHTAEGRKALTVLHGEYGNGRLALVLRRDEDGSVEAKLSVNTGEEDEIAAGEFVVPVHNLPEQLVADALASGLFADTGRRVSSGFVENAPIWRLAAGGAT